MRKISIFVATLALVPTVAFASWWNPFTWGKVKPIEKKAAVIEMIISPTPIPKAEVLVEKKIIPIQKKEIKQEVTEPVNTDILTEADRQNISQWMSFINKERENALDLIGTITGSGRANLVLDVLNILEVYESNLRITQSQLVNAVSINSRNKVMSILAQAQKLHDDYDYEIKIVMDNSIQRLKDDANAENARIEATNARIRAVNNAYLQAQAQQNAINQAKIDAANAYVERYNAIRSQGASEGATEAVVNAQLNAAGLIKSTTCSFSAVGGMTPGAGSMTCY